MKSRPKVGLWGAVGVGLLSLAMVVVVVSESRPVRQVGTIEDFCYALLDGDFRGVVRLLQVDAPPNVDREALGDTMRQVYSERFVEGAPSRLRPEARALRDSIHLATQSYPGDDEVEMIAFQYTELQRQAAGYCP